MLQTLISILTFRGRANQNQYLFTGISLFPIKYLLDLGVASLFGQRWSPANYLFWPDKQSFYINALPPQDRDFALTMLAVALPFIWIGVSFTMARIRDAGLPWILILLFFVPIVNLLLILWLCLAPSRRILELPLVGSAGAGAHAEGAPGEREGRVPVEVRPREVPPLLMGSPLGKRARQMHRRVVGQSDSASFAFACVFSTVFTGLLVYLSANIFQSYGFGIFVGAPFALGWFSSVLYGLNRRRTYPECMAVATMSMVVSGMALLTFAFEGIICLLMALPIASVLVTMGAATGYVMQSRPWMEESSPAMMIGLIICMPGLIAAEARMGLEPELREVTTELIIDAPAERVWQFVISFPPLPEPDEIFFRSGVAYPQHATIEGTGVGAVRHCVFSTGPFVEPITVWDAPRKLAFDVTSQPEPMHELSPWEIHPPHLDHFLVSKRGQFLLESLPDGRTRLKGTTWYTNKMWPEFYWGFLADRIISSIHGRVLKHVKGLAEGE
jgi:uncharacterized membrane protein YhaH (DUF805 family)